MAMHVVRAYLDLYGLSFGPDHGSVQGLVVIVLRIGDVVVELAWNIGPEVVHDAEGRVAVTDRLHQEAHGANVVQATRCRDPCAAFSGRCCRCVSGGPKSRLSMPSVARFLSENSLELA